MNTSLSKMTASKASIWCLFLISFGFACLYVLTRSNSHSWDAIAYTARVADHPFLSERYLSTRYFHPHHLLYIPLAKIATWLPRHTGGEGAIIIYLQALNSILGAGCILLSGLIARLIMRDRWTACIVAVAVGVSNGIWTYSGEVEVMIPALFFLLLAIYLLARNGGFVLWILAGASLAVSILLHQITVLIGVGLILGIAFGTLHRGVYPRKAAIFIGTSFMITIGAYLAVAFYYEELSSLQEIVAWIFSVKDRSQFTDRSLVRTLYLGFRSIADSFVTLKPITGILRGHGVSPGGLVLGLAAVTALALLALWALMRGILFLRWQARPQIFLWRGLLLGVILVAIFILWFEPGNTEYWVYIIPLSWLLWTPGRAASRVNSRSAIRARFSSFVVLALLSCLFVVNMFGNIIDRHDERSAPYRTLLQEARAYFHSGDVLFAPPMSSTLQEGIVALPYFQGIQVRIIPVEEARHAREAGRVLAGICSEKDKAAPAVFVLESATQSIEEYAQSPMHIRHIGSLLGENLYSITSRLGESLED